MIHSVEYKGNGNTSLGGTAASFYDCLAYNCFLLHHLRVVVGIFCALCTAEGTQNGIVAISCLAGFQAVLVGVTSMNIFDGIALEIWD